MQPHCVLNAQGPWDLRCLGRVILSRVPSRSSKSATQTNVQRTSSHEAAPDITHVTPHAHHAALPKQSSKNVEIARNCKETGLLETIGTKRIMNNKRTLGILKRSLELVREKSKHFRDMFERFTSSARLLMTEVQTLSHQLTKERVHIGKAKCHVQNTKKRKRKTFGGETQL